MALRSVRGRFHVPDSAAARLVCSRRSRSGGHAMVIVFPFRLERSAIGVRGLTAAKTAWRSRAGPARDRAQHRAEDAVGTPVRAAPFFGGSACSRAASYGALRSARMNAVLQVGLAQQRNARMLEPMSSSWRMLRLFVLRSILIRPGFRCRQSIVSLSCLSFSHE